MLTNKGDRHGQTCYPLETVVEDSSSTSCVPLMRKKSVLNGVLVGVYA